MSTQKLSAPTLARLRWFANGKKGHSGYVTGGGAAATDRGLERRGFIRYDGTAPDIITDEGRAFLAGLDSK